MTTACKFACLVLLFFPIHSLSQEGPTDAQKDEVYDLIDLAWDYVFIQNDSAIDFSSQALHLARTYQFTKGEALANECHGLYHENVLNDYDSASYYYFQAIDICEKNELPYASWLYHTVGAMFHNLDNYDLAKEYYHTSLELGIEQQDSLIQKQCLSNLASVYSSLEEYEQAEKLFLDCLAIDIAPDYNYACYANLGNLYIRTAQYDKAIFYLEKATNPSPDNNIADANIRLLLDAKTAKKDTTGMKPYLDRAIAYLNGRTEFRNTRLMYNSLSEYFEMAGDFEQALKYEKLSAAIYEQMLEKQKDEAVLSVEAEYQTAKIEDELEHKESIEKIYTYAGIIALILIVFLVILFFRNRKTNSQLNLQKKHLENTVDEKNVLLKETHHRIKNSFQLVSSLLYLQSENADNNEAKMAIKEAENRVRSMVLIHQKLYTSDQLIGIESREYFTNLVNDILESHQVSHETISVNSQIESLVLSVETITPIGLILNELVVNVIKHAFSEDSKNPTITINFKQEGDRLLLEVHDNGVGMTNEVPSSSFGVSLISALSKKIGGALAYPTSSNPGTTAILSINRYEILN